MSDYRKMSIWKDDPLPIDTEPDPPYGVNISLKEWATVVTAFSFVAALGFIVGFFTAHAVM